MRGDRLGNARVTACFLAGESDGLARDRLTGHLARKQPPGRPRGFPVGAQHVQQSGREHHIAILHPFALFDPEHHSLAVDVGHLEVRGFGDAQASGIGGHENRPMLVIGDRVQEVHHFLGTENLREFARAFGHRNLFDCPGAFQGDLVEEAKCPRRDADAAWRQRSDLHQIQLVGANLFRPELIRRAIEVTGIRGNRRAPIWRCHARLLAPRPLRSSTGFGRRSLRAISCLRPSSPTAAFTVATPRERMAGAMLLTCYTWTALPLVAWRIGATARAGNPGASAQGVR